MAARRQNIQPVDGSLVGTDLTTALNDRIRRINAALAASTPVVSTPVATGSSGSMVWGEIPAGVMDGANVTFTLTQSPNPALSLSLYLNGVYQHPGDNYTLAGNTITMSKPPVGADYLMRANYAV